MKGPHVVRSGLVGGLGLLLLVGCVVRGADLAPTDDPARARLTTTVRHGLFLTTVRIGGRELGPFLIDTGSNVLVLDRNLARTLDPAIVWARGQRLDRPWVIFAKPDTPNPPEATWFDGSVGEEALRRFVVVFNYPARKIAFLPAPPAREDIP